MNQSIRDAEDLEDLAIHSRADHLQALLDYARSSPLDAAALHEAHDKLLAMRSIRIAWWEYPLIWWLSKLVRLSFKETIELLEGKQHGDC